MDERSAGGRVGIPLAQQLGAAYFLQRFVEVEGALDATSALAIMELLWEQQRCRYRGNIAAIGARDRRTFVALAAGAADNDILIAIELGDGAAAAADEAILRPDLDRFFPQARFERLGGTSRQLLGNEPDHALVMLRFVSVGGGQPRDSIATDLAVARNALSPYGIACIPFGADAPNSADGLADFLKDARDLVPFAAFPGRLFLCRPALLARYVAFLRSAFLFALDKPETDLLGHRVDHYASRAPALSKAVSQHLEKGISEECDPRIARALEDERHRLVEDVRARHAERARKLAIEGQKIEAERAAHAAERDALVTQLRSMRASTSWRITAPLRKLMAAVRGKSDG